MKPEITRDEEPGPTASVLVPENARAIAVRHRIERAAFVLYLQRNIPDVTVEEIALAAGVSRRTFFRYCPTRDDVLAQIFVRPAVGHIAQLRDRPPGESLVTGWLAIIRSSPMWDDLEHADLFARVMIKRPEHFSRALDRAQKLTTPLMAEVVALRLERDQQCSAAAGAIASTLLSVNSYAFLKWCELGFVGDFATLLETELRSVCQSLCLDCET